MTPSFGTGIRPAHQQPAAPPQVAGRVPLFCDTALAAPWHEEFSREMLIEAERDSVEAGNVRYAALRDGVLAGGATMRLAEGVAQLTGAATAPAHRRRGIQTALLAARLADAAAAGCDVAVIVTQPGSKSQQNAQRQGFDLLYTRAVLVRPEGVHVD